MSQKVKLGRSKFTLGFLTAFLVGIFLADIILLSLLTDIILILICAIAAYFFWQDKSKLLITVVVGGFVIGLTYYHFWDYRENQKTLTYNKDITIDCQVSEKPTVSGANQQLILNYQNTQILVETSQFPSFDYGDNLQIKGIIQDPKQIRTSNNFNYGTYLLKKGIRGQIQNPDKINYIGSGGNIIVKKIYLLGNKMNEVLDKVLSEPYAALQIGLIFGNKTNIPDSLMSAFNRTGTTHIVAVSGYNITIIITAIALILARYSRKLTFFGTLFSIIFFVILTGAGASVLRAGFLAGLASFGKLSGRRPYFPVLILFTATILILFNPYALKNDVSFQLSFLAFVGLVLISPIFENAKLLKSIPVVFKIGLAETLGAQLLVLPILFYNFGILSIIAPLANILVLPIIPWAMLMGFTTIITGFLWIELAHFISILNFILLKYIVIIINYLSNLPWAAITIRSDNWWWIPSYYLTIFILLRSYNRKPEPNYI